MSTYLLIVGEEESTLQLFSQRHNKNIKKNNFKNVLPAAIFYNDSIKLGTAYTHILCLIIKHTCVEKLSTFNAK